MRTLKSKGGFTLVELIVVIAILAILAGVAIPVYNGYIKKAQDAAVITELDAIQTAAQAANATAGQVSVVYVSGTEILVTAVDYSENFDKDFEMFCDGAKAKAETGNANYKADFTATVDIANTSYKNGAVWVPAAAKDVVYDGTNKLNCVAGWNAIPDAE